MVPPLLISQTERGPRRLFPWARPGPIAEKDKQFKSKIQKHGLEGKHFTGKGGKRNGRALCECGSEGWVLENIHKVMVFVCINFPIFGLNPPLYSQSC